MSYFALLCLLASEGSLLGNRCLAIMIRWNTDMTHALFLQHHAQTADIIRLSGYAGLSLCSGMECSCARVWCLYTNVSVPLYLSLWLALVMACQRIDIKQNACFAFSTLKI
jgi:hypothetical protein